MLMTRDFNALISGGTSFPQPATPENGESSKKKKKKKKKKKNKDGDSSMVSFTFFSYLFFFIRDVKFPIKKKNLLGPKLFGFWSICV